MTKRPAVALVLVLSLLSTAFVFQAPAAGATHASFTGQESVRAGLSGSLCLDTGEGRVTSSVPALNGDVTVRSRSFTNHLGYGFVFGSWTLTPEGTEGSVSGFAFGRVRPARTTLRWFGAGEAELSGIRVQLRTTSTGCNDNSALVGTLNAMQPTPQTPEGARVAVSTNDFATTVTNLTDAITANPNLGLVKTVDHQAGAASRDLTLLPTTEVFFGNPRLGTPLMQSAQTTGIDLPQKMLIWEDALGQVKVAWNAPQYLEARHNLTDVDGQLTTIGNALAGLASVATGATVVADTSAAATTELEGLTVRTSSLGVDETFETIVAALDAAPPINVVFTLEHDQNAARVDLDLAPTKLIVFGNPSLGTPLMQINRTVALDLPQRILVWQEGDEVFVAYNDPSFVADRHGIPQTTPQLAIIAGALANFTSQVQ